MSKYETVYHRMLEYIREKEAMGILDLKGACHSGLWGQLTFLTTRKTYKEVLCPGIAQLCYSTQLAPKLIYTPDGWEHTGYVRGAYKLEVRARDIRKRDVPAITAFLREGRCGTWFAEYEEEDNGDD